MYLSKRPYCTSNTSSFKQNQELIAGNPVPALCRSNAASSPPWLQITSQLRKWDWKWEESKKLTTLLFMVVTQLFHWFVFFSPAESKECWVGVPWLCVVCEQAKGSSFEGAVWWRGQWGWAWRCWMTVSSGRKRDDGSSWGANSFLGQHCYCLFVSCLWRCFLLLLSCIYLQEHGNNWVPKVVDPLKSSPSPLLLFPEDFSKEKTCLNFTTEKRPFLQNWENCPGPQY